MRETPLKKTQGNSNTYQEVGDAEEGHVDQGPSQIQGVYVVA